MLFGEDERLPGEFREYAPYHLGYDEEQSLNEIEYAIHKGSIDEQTMSDFREYLGYLKKKLSNIVTMELGEGNPVGDLTSAVSRIKELLLNVANKPVL